MPRERRGFPPAVRQRQTDVRLAAAEQLAVPSQGRQEGLLIFFENYAMKFYS